MADVTAFEHSDVEHEGLVEFPLQMGDFQVSAVNFPGCMFDVFVKGQIGIFHCHELKYRRGGWILIYWILLVSLIDGTVGCLVCFSWCD